MHSHDLLREVFKDGNPKQIAEDLGLSLSMIYKWAEPVGETGSGTTNPLDRVHALIESTQDDRIPQWISEKGGGFFIRNPETTHPHPDYLIPACSCSGFGRRKRRVCNDSDFVILYDLTI